VIDADQLAREVQAPGSPELAAIARRFGAAMLRPDGSLDRDALRARVLGDPDALAALNAIVHPAVARRRAERTAAARAAGARVLVYEVPLLFEALDPAEFDLVVLVDAPEAVRRARLVAGRGLAPDEADRLLASQLPAGPKRERSEVVIENTGTMKELEARARDAWTRLAARAGSA